MLKKYLLSLILLFGGVSLSLNAQSDSFFRNGYDNDYTNRDNITNDITLGGVTNDENPTVPVGSGLLIMVAAGAGYAVARRKGAARKGMTMILALGLILGMTQCKKNTVTPVTPAGNSVHITLNANFGGEKTGFDPANGTFNWSNGTTEFINVGGKKTGYLGQLQGTWSEDPTAIVFSGNITPASDEEMLYFFYLGNGDHASATTLDFSNQVGDLDHITNWHIAIGNAGYTSGQTSFTTTLDMAMAIAYFDLSGFGSETVTLFGNDVYSTATIDYKNGTITGAAKGNINLGTANSGKYVALIPSVNNETVLQFDSNSKTGIMRFLRGIKPASYYSNSGEALSVTANALFSVSSTKKVRFSRGNLQYNKTASEWSFMEHQFSTVETPEMSIGTNYANQNIVSLFGWGTSGYESKYPYMTATAGYYTDNITDTDYDWGKYNSSSITNGGGYSGWYTLSESEWTWLIGPTKSSPNPGTNCRSVSNTLSDQARFTLAIIDNTYKGMIIFPDTYTHPEGATITGATYNTYSAYTATLTMDDWNKMENAGAIFLPVAGFRNNTTVRYTDYSSNYVGEYWSTTKNGTNYTTMYFKNNQISYYGESVYKGCSVRLVRE